MTSTPAIVRRAEWGANESWRGHDPEYAPVKMAFVHHTVNANSYSRAQAPGIVRGIYYYDTKGLKWSDLGYNFLVDRYGTVYEGRYGGITSGVIGAQVLGFNTSSTGIAMIGTFSIGEAAVGDDGALKRLLAWKLDVHHVDPEGQARMLGAATTQKFTEGETVVLPAIAGHRQANYTACPGDALYRLLPGVRTAVGGMGLPKIYEYRVGTVDLSPNGDGVHETTRVRFRNSEVADWTVEVLDKPGEAVRTHVRPRRDRRPARGTAATTPAPSCATGVPASSAAPAPPAPTRGAATVTVRVDTVAPAAADRARDAGRVQPERGRLRRPLPAALHDRRGVLGEGLRRRRRGRDPARRRSPGSTPPAGARSAAWDGRISSAGTLVGAPEGEALLRARPQGRRRQPLVGRDDGAHRPHARLPHRHAGHALAERRRGQGRDGARVHAHAPRHGRARGHCATARSSARSGAATYAAGTSSVTWDGRSPTASRATSGTYRVKATATSALGEVGARADDRRRPLPAAPRRRRRASPPTLGKRARVDLHRQGSLQRQGARDRDRQRTGRGRRSPSSTAGGSAGHAHAGALEAAGAPHLHADADRGGPRRQPPVRGHA